MLKILLIWWLTLVGAPDHFSPPPSYTFVCHEYTLTIDSRGYLRSDSVCYTSFFAKKHDRHLLTIITNRTTYDFAILRTDGGSSIAVIVGQPNQLYALNERIMEDRYYFSVYPIPQHSRSPRPVKGRALEVSTEEICKL